jgi:hypothetical protein
MQCTIPVQLNGQLTLSKDEQGNTTWTVNISDLNNSQLVSTFAIPQLTGRPTLSTAAKSRALPPTAPTIQEVQEVFHSKSPRRGRSVTPKPDQNRSRSGKSRRQRSRPSPPRPTSPPPGNWIPASSSRAPHPTRPPSWLVNTSHQQAPTTPTGFPPEPPVVQEAGQGIWEDTPLPFNVFQPAAARGRSPTTPPACLRSPVTPTRRKRRTKSESLESRRSLSPMRLNAFQIRDTENLRVHLDLLLNTINQCVDQNFFELVSVVHC